MARSSYTDYLASVALFSACSKQELQAVARGSDELDLAAGRTLCEQGRVGREAFVILEGTADVIVSDKKIATLGPGACFGELALLDHGPRTATVVASTDLKVLVIGAREFAALLDDAPSIARKLLKSLATRIRELDAQTFS